jgi:isopentenyldiphosphate isomerase
MKYSLLLMSEAFMTTISISDEYLDLVDENDNIIGKKKRSEIYAETLFNYRVINAFLVNSKGKIWIPRRHRNKKYFSSCLDVSIGGHVESGENYEQALAREAMEELNINVTQFPNRFLGHLRPQKDKLSYFINVY